MPKLRERLHALRELRLKNKDILYRNAADPHLDRTGSSSTGLMHFLRFQAVAAFVLDNDIQQFQTGLQQAGKIRLSLFERFDRGEPISPSVVTLLAYKELFDLLAARAFETAHELACKMENRHDVSKKENHPFDRALGHALQSLILQKPEVTDAIGQLHEICARTTNQDFRGYPRAFQAIHEMRPLPELQDCLANILHGHKKQSTRGVFADTLDEILPLWPLGLVNLARQRGLPLSVDHPLLPRELIFP